MSKDNAPEWITRAKAVPVGIEDMVMLVKPDVKGIVENLEARLKAGTIYTYIGHVLCVCNPYQWLDIYGPSTVAYYVHKQRIDAPPHIFGVAEAAYRQMIGEEERQCVIISGESGAGKTEASKQIQNYIAAVSGGGGNPAHAAAVESVKHIFLQSNPLLEAFGNAKTLRNNNSSRFGKYFELMFDRYGSPQGGHVTNYLLEKSRIVKPGKGERNFHVFYQLLRGASPKVKDSFGLTGGASDYSLTNCGNCTAVDGMDDSKEFNDTLAAMKAVTMKGREIEASLKMVALVVHLCNASFVPLDIKGAEGSKVKGRGLAEAAAVMGCGGDSDGSKGNSELEKALAHALTSRTLHTMAPGGKVETYEVPLNPTQASAARDSLAKTIYSRLFDKLVLRVNSALDAAAPPRTKSKGGDDDDDDGSGDENGGSSASASSIGVLDIYGFEVFENNGFEQLCINYVNEKLQQIFIELTLKAEQDEYAHEGIAWKPIPFFNNKIVCDLVEAKGKSGLPPGVLPILDDVCRTMHARSGNEGLDEKFVETVAQFHNKHAHFMAGNSRGFTVKHYAGDVNYRADGFGDANRDALRPDLVLLCQNSSWTDKGLRSLFPEVIDLDDKKAPPTAGSVIRQQCGKLVTALMDCTPHYVRCVKSNDAKAPKTIDKKRASHQCQYLGLPENIRVRRAGFAYRAEYHRFLDRFRIISKDTWPRTNVKKLKSDRDACRSICAAAAAHIPSLTKEECQLGRTKLFVRQPETFFELEKLRVKMVGNLVASIQRGWRRFRDRRKFVLMQQATAKKYLSAGKQRRPGSLYRPYQGDYLPSNSGKNTNNGEAMQLRACLDEHLAIFGDSAQAVVFLDDVRRLCPAHRATSHYPPQGPHNSGAAASSRKHVPTEMAATEAVLNGALEMRRQLLAVTPSAVYLFERCDRRLNSAVPKNAAKVAAAATAGSGSAAAAAAADDEEEVAPAAPPALPVHFDGRRDARGVVIPRGSANFNQVEPAKKSKKKSKASSSTNKGAKPAVVHYGGQEGLDPLIGKRLPLLVLRRRVPMDLLEGLTLSKQADIFIMLQVNPCRVPPPTGNNNGSAKKKAAGSGSGGGASEGDMSFWVKDSAAPTCQVSGASFTLFSRKHHCRATGQVTCDAASNVYLPLPDLGWGNEPQRVSDPALGWVNVEPLEDVVLLTDKKSELQVVLAPLINDANNNHHQSSNPLQQNGHGSGASGGGAAGAENVAFSDVWTLRPSMSSPGSSLVPARVLKFTCAPSPSPLTFTSGPNHKVTLPGGGGGSNLPAHQDPAEVPLDKCAALPELVVVSPPGLPEELLKDRMRRAEKRRRKREKRRAEEQALEKERKAQRDAQLEADRRARLKAKKEKKAAEKAEALRKEAEDLEAASGQLKGLKLRPSTGGSGARVKFGGKDGSGGGDGASLSAPPPASANSELAAKLARRRAE